MWFLLRRRVVWMALAGVLVAGEARAERAWIRGEVRLNLRAEPETHYRILDVVKTGDRVEVLERRGDWVKLREPDGNEGWIRAGYLQSEPPPSVLVTRLETELSTLGDRMVRAQAELASLRSAKQALDGRQDEIEQLRLENRALGAAERWSEWITGAAILAAGMLIGGALQRSGNRRAGRIRL